MRVRRRTQAVRKIRKNGRCTSESAAPRLRCERINGLPAATLKNAKSLGRPSNQDEEEEPKGQCAWRVKKSQQQRPGLDVVEVVIDALRWVGGPLQAGRW